MDRLKLMLTMFSAVFLFSLASNAQDAAAEAVPEAAAAQAEEAAAPAPSDGNAEKAAEALDHSKMDHGKKGCTGGKDCGCDKCRGKSKAVWHWKAKTDMRINHHFSSDDDISDLNKLFVRGMLSGKANVDDTFYGKISFYGVADSPDRNPLNLYQAWVKWAPNEMFRVKAGLLDTSFFGYTDLYKEHPDTLRGAMVKLKSDYAHVSVLYARHYDADFPIVDETTGAVGNTDTQLDYYGLNVKLAQLPEFISKIKLSYYLQAGLDNEEGRNSLTGDLLDRSRQIHMFGGLAKAGVEGLKVKGKFFWQQGTDLEDDSFNAHVVHAKASYTLAQALNTTVWGGYHRDSENFQPFFYDQHSMAGYGDVLALGNLTYFNFGLKVVPVEGLHLGAGYHIFMKTNADEATNFYNAPRNWEAEDNLGESNIGNELDFWVKKKFNHGISAKLRYVNFQPKAGLDIENSDNRVELRLVSKF